MGVLEIFRLILIRGVNKVGPLGWVYILFLNSQGFFNWKGLHSYMSCPPMRSTTFQNWRFNSSIIRLKEKSNLWSAEQTFAELVLDEHGLENCGLRGQDCSMDWDLVMVGADQDGVGQLAVVQHLLQVLAKPTAETGV